jgi:hypothetical protein
MRATGQFSLRHAMLSTTIQAVVPVLSLKRRWRIRYSVVLFALLLSFCAVPVVAEQNVEFIYPLVVRRPVLETLLDLTVNHEKGRDERETELAAELEFRALPRWLVALEVPLLIKDPEKKATQAGVSDIGMSNRFLLFSSLERQAQVTGGFELTVPSGSKHRGLGGETAIEPFLVGGVRVKKVQLVVDAAYAWTLNSPDPGERKQEFSAGLAAGYELTTQFFPLLELTTVRKVRGRNEEDSAALRGQEQLYLTPGLNLKLRDEVVLRFGVQVPVTNTREFDYALRLGLSWEF